MQHSFELAPTRGSSLGDGEELWMEWAGRVLSGTVAEGGVVLRMWVLIVVGWWLGFDHGQRRRECGGWVLTSRGQGRERDSKGGCFARARYKSAVRKTSLDLGGELNCSFRKVTRNQEESVITRRCGQSFGSGEAERQRDTVRCWAGVD